MEGYSARQVQCAQWERELYHTWPDIANAVREISKTMDGATVCQLQEMHRVICYVLSTGGLGLRMNPIVTKNKWILQVFSNSDFVNDLETRISVYGFIFYWCGVPVSWKSKGIRSVVLLKTDSCLWSHQGGGLHHTVAAVDECGSATPSRSICWQCWSKLAGQQQEDKWTNQACWYPIPLRLGIHCKWNDQDHIQEVQRQWFWYFYQEHQDSFAWKTQQENGLVYEGNEWTKEKLWIREIKDYNDVKESGSHRKDVGKPRF